MDHAAAHERIADLLLEPARLAAFDRSTAPEDVELREHLAACPDCRADLETWSRLGRAVGAALPRDASSALEAVEPIDAPPSLRARVIGAVHDAAQEDTGGEPGVPGDAVAPVSLAAARTERAERAERARRRARRFAPWLGLAASLAVILGASAITLDQAARRADAERQSAILTDVVAAVDRVLATDHVLVALRTPAGAGAGSISWSRHDWVVLTTALTEPPAAQRYKCFLVDGDASVMVGEMAFAGGTAYWVGSLDAWATWEIGPATKFVVTLEAADAQTRTGATVLQADLGS
jgi:hypothetical protein